MHRIYSRLKAARYMFDKAADPESLSHSGAMYFLASDWGSRTQEIISCLEALTHCGKTHWV